MSNSNSGSAFSRLTTALSSASSGSNASGGSPASGSAAPQDALAALEAQLLKGRKRQESSDSRPRSERGNSGSRSRASSSQRYSPTFMFGASIMDSPMPEEFSASQSRISQAAGSLAGAGWGGEALPPNATGAGYNNYSAFSSFAPGSASVDGSHFFPPGAGFSFEGESGSPSLNAATSLQFRQSRQRHMPADNSFSLPSDSSPASYWERSASKNGRGPSLTRDGRRRTQSRGMYFTVPVVASGDRGLVGFAKPREGALDRVAVAGKTYLKILKVPTTGGNSRPSTPPTSLAAPSSIASRRSRSRQTRSTFEEESLAKSEITETLDVKFGSRLGPAFMFTDVRWGHGATSNKVATPFSNGAVVLWDLAKEGGSRVDQTMYQHDRAVNRVVFGGASGNYLLSAGQDGLVKLWDIREGRATNNVLKTSSPVRQIAFSPSASQPWTLLATCSSGTLIRSDLRNASSSRPGASITDRIAGHVGGCLAMDWRDNYESDGPDRRDGGWVVTGGLDSTIKIWDFSLPVLSTKPVRTLHSSQGVQAVAWHPTRENELASSPLPSLSISRSDDALPSASTTPNQEVSSGRLAPGSSWKNEIELWDTRREHYPVMAIKTDEPISAITYSDDDTIWSTSKSTPTFSQFDVQCDSYSLLEGIPRPTAPWSVDGEMVFIDDAKGRRTPPSLAVAVDAPPLRPASYLSSVFNFDPAYSARAFEHLANSLVLFGKSFADICDTNAEAYESVERPDASQLWLSMKTWLGDTEFPFVPSSPTEDVPVDPTPRAASPTSGPVEWQISASAAATPASARRSFSKSLPRNRSNLNSPVILALDSQRSMDNSPLVLEPEAARTLGPTLATIPQGAPYRDDCSLLTSSDSEHDHHHLLRSSAANVAGNRQRSTTILGLHNTNGTASVGPDDGTLDGDLDDFGLPPSASRLQSRPVSSSSGSEDSDAEREHVARVRNKTLAAKQVPRSRRASSSLSADRRPLPPKENRSRQVSHDAINMSRRGSAQVGLAGAGAKLAPQVEEGPTSAELCHQAGLEFSSTAKEIFKRQVKHALQDYADQGDSQLCATVCTVLRDFDLEIDALFTARVTKAYLGLLRRTKLDVAAAGLLKVSAVDAMQKLSQTNVVYHTACGKCGKGLEASPYGFCPRCATQRTRCCICHLVAHSLIVMCAHCGHGAHPDCLEAYYASLSSALDVQKGAPSVPSGEASYASTPGIAAPGTRTWMWGEESAEVGGEVAELEMAREVDLQEHVATCPAGQCGHYPCYLIESVA